jgi:DNA-binding FadR family transcriptional regulator
MQDYRNHGIFCQEFLGSLSQNSSRVIYSGVEKIFRAYIPMAHSYSMTIHEKILQLLRGKNKKEVEELVREHMLIAMDRLLSSKSATPG